MKNSPYLDLPLRTLEQAQLDRLKAKVRARFARKISKQCGHPVIIDEAHYPLKEA